MTQTNYNDGLWHGWNGGECPVHLLTLVETAWSDGRIYTFAADSCEWDFDNDDESPRVIAFRVIKEHREPREFWLTSDFEVYTNHEEAQRKSIGLGGIIHVREVRE